eukprot:SAG31_NODE_1542_length_7951_cov_4.038844_4_plen_83_part_00
MTMFGLLSGARGVAAAADAAISNTALPEQSEEVGSITGRGGGARARARSEGGASRAQRASPTEPRLVLRRGGGGDEECSSFL